MLIQGQDGMYRRKVTDSDLLIAITGVLKTLENDLNASPYFSIFEITQGIRKINTGFHILHDDVKRVFLSNFVNNVIPVYEKNGVQYIGTTTYQLYSKIVNNVALSTAKTPFSVLDTKDVKSDKYQRLWLGNIDFDYVEYAVDDKTHQLYITEANNKTKKRKIVLSV